MFLSKDVFFETWETHDKELAAKVKQLQSYAKENLKKQ